MAELDSVDSNDNYNFRVIPLFLQVCMKRSQVTPQNGGMFEQGWFGYISVTKVWVLDTSMPWEQKKSFDPYQTLSSMIFIVFFFL